MDKLHITQDDFGYWMLSVEREDGTLSLVAHQFESPTHLIENATEMVAEGKVSAVILIDTPRTMVTEALLGGARRDYTRPAPRKVGV